jgi:hypothetical protein
VVDADALEAGAAAPDVPAPLDPEPEEKNEELRLDEPLREDRQSCEDGRAVALCWGSRGTVFGDERRQLSSGANAYAAAPIPAAAIRTSVTWLERFIGQFSLCRLLSRKWTRR